MGGFASCKTTLFLAGRSIPSLPTSEVLARMQKVSRTGHNFSNTRPGEVQRVFRNSFQIWQSENAPGRTVLRIEQAMK